MLPSFFRGQYYKQMFGTGIGSPVLVTVANLVMVEIKQQAKPSPILTHLSFLEALCR